MILTPTPLFNHQGNDDAVNRAIIGGNSTGSCIVTGKQIGRAHV